MTDRERLVEILEKAGYMTQFPGSLARILLEHGLRFAPVEPCQYDSTEVAYKNGAMQMKKTVIEKMKVLKVNQFGSGAHRALAEAIEAIEKLEVR